MGDPSPSKGERSSTTTITDLTMDSLAHCSNYLSLQDISNMAITCKYLNTVAYSDSIWHRLFREQWPQQLPSGFSVTSGVREAFLGRHSALQQFKFVDPLVADYYTHAKPYNHMFLCKNDIIFSQGSLISMIDINSFINGRDSLVTLSDHNARITSMRLFSLNETSLFRSERHANKNVLVTSSCDHTIRLWWKGRCQRCFRGHNGPVSTLSDKLLGNNAKILASGGEDGTVRLWSLSSSGKSGQQATLYGHEKPVALMSVAGHKTSLLVSMSRDSKVRVWDTNAASAVRSSCCVGMTSVRGAPVGIKCHDSLLYIAAGSSVVAIDLRTMQKALSTKTNEPKLYSFEMMPSKSLICTGGYGIVMLWDIRKSCDTQKAEPISELDGHVGAVTHLHMDSYKIVTGGHDDPYVNVWEVDSGSQTNFLLCSSQDGSSSPLSGCSAMAVNGCRIVTASCGEHGCLRLRDYNTANSVTSEETELTSKFWGPQSYSEPDESNN